MEIINDIDNDNEMDNEVEIKPYGLESRNRKPDPATIKHIVRHLDEILQIFDIEYILSLTFIDIEIFEAMHKYLIEADLTTEYSAELVDKINRTKLNGKFAENDLMQYIKYYSLTLNSSNVNNLLHITNFKEMAQIVQKLNDLSTAYVLANKYLPHELTEIYQHLITEDQTIFNDFIKLLYQNPNLTIFYNQHLEGLDITDNMANIKANRDSFNMYSHELGDKIFYINSYKLHVFGEMVNIYKWNYSDLILNTIKYSESLQLENPVLRFKMPYDNLDMIKKLHQIGYQFNYFCSISSIEIFNYLYNETNFNQFLNETLDQKLYYDHQYNILSNLWNFEVFAYIANNYLGSHLYEMIQCFDILRYMYDDYDDPHHCIKIIKESIRLGYDYQKHDFYAVLNKWFNHTGYEDEDIEYLLTLNLDQKILNRFYWMLLYHDNKNLSLLVKIYDRIDQLEYNQSIHRYDKIFISHGPKLFAKIADINPYIRYISSIDVLKIIINRYNHINCHLLVENILHNYILNVNSLENLNYTAIQQIINLIQNYNSYFRLSWTSLLLISQPYIDSESSEYGEKVVVIFREVFRDLIEGD